MALKKAWRRCRLWAHFITEYEAFKNIIAHAAEGNYSHADNSCALIS